MNKLWFSLFVAELVLAGASYSLAINPIVSPEFDLDAAIYVPRIGPQEFPAVAFNGTNYLVVWLDGFYGTYQVRGARVSLAGELLDPLGILITPGTYLSQQAFPAVASNGRDFLVAWGGATVRGARVSGAGALLDATPITIGNSANPWPSTVTAAASVGTGYLVAWEDYRADPNYANIYGARVNSAGTVLDPAGIPISTAANNQLEPAMASNGTNYLVVWEDQRNFQYEIYGTLVSTAGVVANPNGINLTPFDGDQLHPALASNGTDFLLAWEDLRSGYHIYGARVTSLGARADANGFPICVAATEQHSPAAAGNAGGYMVAWEDVRSGGSSGIYGTQISAAGQVASPNGAPLLTATNSLFAPAVGASSNAFLATWSDDRNDSDPADVSNPDIYATRINSAGSVLDQGGFVVSTGWNSEASPAVAFNGSEYLVVWVDGRNSQLLTTGFDIYAARVSSSGAMLDQAALPVCRASAAQFTPVVASNGRDFLVAWTDLRNDPQGITNRDIYGARVTAEGVVADPNGIPICTITNNQSSPAIASDGEDYFVVWQDARDNFHLPPPFYDAVFGIYGARVSRLGTVLDPVGLKIEAYPNYGQANPAVAYNGTDYLVAWQDTRNSTQVFPMEVDIYGRLLDRSGAQLAPGLIPICATPGSQTFPTLAANGRDFLAVWQDSRNQNGTGSDLYDTLVSGSGVVANPTGVALSTAPLDQSSPRAAANGTNFLVTWQDAHNGGDIFAARVSGAGVKLDPAGFAVNATALSQSYPACASGSDGRYLVVCQEDIPNQTSRLKGNLVGTPPPVIQQFRKTNGAATVFWFAESGANYRVQYKTTLSAAAWTTLDGEVAGLGSLTNKVDSSLGADALRFYRLILLP